MATKVGTVQPNAIVGLPGGLPTMPAGHIGLVCADLGTYLTVPLNTGGVQVVGGGPQHDIAARAGRRGVPEYRGHDPLRLDIAILLDGYPSENVEPTLDELDAFSARLPNEIRMPAIELQGGHVPRPYRGREWVVDGPITFDDTPEPIRVTLQSGPRLVRQAVTLHLLEKVTYKLLTDSVSRSRRQAKGQKKTPAVYKVRQGQDDLGDVSKAVYGTRNRAVDIAQFNRISVASRLRPGQRLRIP
jgi:hypothetical protein